MYPIVWFALVAALSVLYARRAEQLWGRPAHFIIDWPIAVIASGAVMAVSFFIADADMKAYANLSLLIHSVGVPIILFFALVAWRRERWWVYVAGCLALVLWSSFVVWEDVFRNLLLITTALGISLCGRYSSTRGFVVCYVLLAGFDIYAVLGSDIMNKVVNTYPGPFPTMLFIKDGAGFSRGLGAGDVIFTAIACQNIYLHQGISRACIFVAACTVSLLLCVGLVAAVFPYLVIISPLALLFLLIPKGFVRIE